MATLTKADKARLEQAWLALFCSAISGYRPDDDAYEKLVQNDEAADRDELYLDDAVNFAENAADNGLAVFCEKFGEKPGGKISVARKSNEDEDE